MVSNLLVVLCGDSRATPVVNTGTLYSVTAPESAGPDRREGARPPAGRRRRERKSVLLRLDPEVHEALTRWAADDLRSTNAHIEWLLRRAVTEAGRLRRDDAVDRPRSLPTIKEFVGTEVDGLEVRRLTSPNPPDEFP